MFEGSQLVSIDDVEGQHVFGSTSTSSRGCCVVVIEDIRCTFTANQPVGLQCCSAKLFSVCLFMLLLLLPPAGR
jgi:hypothetical protein